MEAVALALFQWGFHAPSGGPRELLHALAAVLGLPAVGVSVYSKVHMLLMLYAAVDELLAPRWRSPMVPALLVDSLATCGAFHAEILLCPGAARRLATRLGWGLREFHARNLVAHVLPPALLLFWFSRDPDGYRLALGRPALRGAGLGLVTFVVHSAWAHRVAGGLRLWLPDRPAWALRAFDLAAHLAAARLLALA